MNSLLLLLALFTIGYGFQCPKCVTNDYSNVSGFSEEMKTLIESTQAASGADCDAPEMATCEDNDMECVTLSTKVSYEVSSENVEMENVSHLQKECVARSATCSDMQTGFDYVNQMLEGAMVMKLQYCNIQFEPNNRYTNTESDTESHAVSFSFSLAAALPLLALLL
ncbi:uncharacterized protein LOC134821750 [Bolinopsis microptera]|uniref:uncharacterized protein LOC134821750 n=1 Tax=Bolinopsis microptera TaxID=2820187 RepID=UPI0030795440